MTPEEPLDDDMFINANFRAKRADTESRSQDRIWSIQFLPHRQYQRPLPRRIRRNRSHNQLHLPTRRTRFSWVRKRRPKHLATSITTATVT